MRLLAGVAFAAMLAAPAAASADTLLFNNFQNYSNGGWVQGDRGAIGTSEYAGNVTLRLAALGSGTQALSTVGYTGVTVSLTFYALMLGAHGQCVAEASIDDGANWIRIFRVSRGGDNGTKPNPVNKAMPELDNQAKVIFRLKNTSQEEQANCWVDDISITATSNGGPHAPLPPAPTTASAGGGTPAPATPASGFISWDPNAPVADVPPPAGDKKKKN